MDDFQSAKEMADYLISLMANRTAYLEYFKWRQLGWARAYQTKEYRYDNQKIYERECF